MVLSGLYGCGLGWVCGLGLGGEEEVEGRKLELGGESWD